jgi:signal transduction histidine kinase
MALKMKAKETLEGVYEKLSKIQTAMGEHEKALESYKIARQYADSLKNTKVERETTQKIAKYEYEKKEALLKQSQAEERLTYLHREAELKAQQIEERLENDKQQALLQAEHEKKEGVLKAQQAQQKAEFAHKEEIAKADELKRVTAYEQAALRQKWIIILILSISFFITALTVIVLRNRNQIKKAYHELTYAHGEIKHQQEEILSQAEELKTINQQLVELDKFKQNLTGMIAHDLKNPVNALLNLSFERNPDYPQQIKSYAQQMQMLILNMLDVQKFEEARMVLDKNIVSLNEIVAEAHKQVEYLAKQKIL